MEGTVNVLSNLSDITTQLSWLIQTSISSITLLEEMIKSNKNPSLDFDLGGPFQNSQVSSTRTIFIPTHVDDLFDELPDLGLQCRRVLPQPRRRECLKQAVTTITTTAKTLQPPRRILMKP
ncbi:hypothetical protein Rs2_47718 [Raphanus sativus]|nr:hypothetical protein Rs2_47718 [Raphanus sativus]